MNKKNQSAVLTVLLMAATVIVTPAAQADELRAKKVPTGVGSITNHTTSSLVRSTANSTAVKTSARKARVTVKHSSRNLRAGESIRLIVTGTAANSKPLAKKNARLQYRAKDSTKWKTLGTKKTNKNGRATLYWRAEKSGQYRIAITPAKGKTAVVSKVLNVSVSKGNRTLKERVEVARNELGKPTRATQRLNSKALKNTSSKAKTVRFQNFKSATVVEVEKGKTVKTWIVRGKINTLYRKSGGTTGTYGVPVSDAKCGLLDEGCVQRFSKGTIYSSNYKKVATAVSIRGLKGEVAAAAQSQVGYRKIYSGDASVQSTKYNKWSGRSHAWCAMFVFWAADASGNSDIIPEVYRIPNQVAWVKKNWKVNKNSPKVGDVAFMDLRGIGRPTHVGYVVGVKNGRVTLIEGNTASAFPTRYRGVVKNNRPVSRIAFFGRPNW